VRSFFKFCKKWKEESVDYEDTFAQARNAAATHREGSGVD